jgi:hypothetical protein
MNLDTIREPTQPRLIDTLSILTTEPYDPERQGFALAPEEIAGVSIPGDSTRSTGTTKKPTCSISGSETTTEAQDQLARGVDDPQHILKKNRAIGS